MFFGYFAASLKITVFFPFQITSPWNFEQS